VDSVEQLEAHLEEARTWDQTLYVNIGRIARIEEHRPELLRHIEAGDRFEEVATLHGFQPEWTRKVYRFSGGSRGEPGEP